MSTKAAKRFHVSGGSGGAQFKWKGEKVTQAEVLAFFKKHKGWELATTKHKAHVMIVAVEGKVSASKKKKKRDDAQVVTLDDAVRMFSLVRKADLAFLDAADQKSSSPPPKKKKKKKSSKKKRRKSPVRKKSSTKGSKKKKDMTRREVIAAIDAGRCEDIKMADLREYGKTLGLSARKKADLCALVIEHKADDKKKKQAPRLYEVFDSWSAGNLDEEATPYLVAEAKKGADASWSVMPARVRCVGYRIVVVTASGNIITRECVDENNSMAMVVQMMLKQGAGDSAMDAKIRMAISAGDCESLNFKELRQYAKRKFKITGRSKASICSKIGDLDF